MTRAQILVQLSAGDDAPEFVAIARQDATPRITPAHRHTQGQLLGSSEGLVTVGFSGGHPLAPPSHAVWIPPNHPHSIQSHGPFNGYSVYIAARACRALPPVPHIIRVSGLLREAVARAATWTRGELDTSQQRIAGVILDEIRRSPGEALVLPLPNDRRLTAVTQSLLDNLSDQRDLTAWAACAAMSPRSFSRHFVAETGLTFADWRLRARSLRALELLADGLPVTTIALDVGYGNTSAFIAAFKKTFGGTPTQYLASVKSH
jgi:AraC-like DNA-binding protein